ncbi:hypothetical protein A2U01_0054020 [Trifolium medium]|uniref:Uncharacterized protein n=1 Tax=Trifolium medium TaxID=97028 RepID=A0A392RAD0_9FABA|nr:hypothetical protein [Trifolium medium]
MGRWVSNDWSWDLKWRRQLFVWEEELLDNLFRLTVAVNFTLNPDSWLCSIGVEGIYTVKEGYNFLASNFLPPSTLNPLECRLLNSVWFSYAPAKTIIF